MSEAVVVISQVSTTLRKFQEIVSNKSRATASQSSGSNHVRQVRISKKEVVTEGQFFMEQEKFNFVRAEMEQLADVLVQFPSLEFMGKLGELKNVLTVMKNNWLELLQARYSNSP